MDKIYNIYTNKEHDRLVGLTYTSPIFGPIHSRRLGLSLGINLLPGDGKKCTFDCLYCECGLNAYNHTTTSLPTCHEVSKALEDKLKEMKSEGQVPDVLTFAGNGEPTLNPHFPEIIDETTRLRNLYCPQAKISVLSNSTQLKNENMLKALMKVDNPIMKLDTVDEEYIRLVDRPAGNYKVEKIIEQLCRFNGNVIIQTMFMTGTLTDGTSVDNTSDIYIDRYLSALEKIKPLQVMIYTIDRETPVSGLQKATPQQLDHIAEKIREKSIEVSISY